MVCAIETIDAQMQVNEQGTVLLEAVFCGLCY